MNIKVLGSARRIVADGIRFHERQEAGLGAYFLGSIMSDLRSVKICGRTSKVQRLILQSGLQKIPYSIYYKQRDPKQKMR